MVYPPAFPHGAGVPEHADAPGGLPPGLFERFQGGDEQALREVVVLFEARLFGVARLYARSAEDAEEAVQDSFLRLYVYRARIHGPEAVFPWLCATVRREAIRQSGTAWRRHEFPVDPADLVEMQGGVEGEQVRLAEAEYRAEVVRSGLAALRPKEREVILLRYFAGLQLKEIAAMRQIPMGTVGVLIQRALAKMRKRLADRGLEY